MTERQESMSGDQPWANTDQVPERFQAVAAGAENAGPHSVSAAHMASHLSEQHHDHDDEHGQPPAGHAHNQAKTKDSDGAIRAPMKGRGRAGQSLREHEESQREMKDTAVEDKEKMQQFGEVGPQGQPVVGNAAGYQVTEEDVLEALRDVIDPELGINIVDLGLVYGVELQDDGGIRLEMTLTSAACPLTDVIEEQTNMILSAMATSVDIEWVWMPPWGPDRITEEGRDQLRALGFNV